MSKDSKTNALISNTDQNKRIESAYKHKKSMKKYRFKRSHNKRKINNKANYTISIKKQKGSTKCLKK